MPLKIPVAHDFVCPWCWVALFQAKRLIAEEGVEIDWKGYELWPAELEKPVPNPPAPVNPDRPPVPSRLDFFLIADDVELPKVERPKGILTHNAHEAVEFAKANGRGFEFCELLYRAYWEHGVNINDPAQLFNLAAANGIDEVGLMKTIAEKTYNGNIVGFDDAAYANGVYNVPTFTIGGDRYAEQPYAVLVKAVRTAKQP
jgi:predicted DsbA family dithiol-disulfide isomerase